MEFRASSESNLVGRKQLRSVRVRMTKTWDCWVEVEATSDRDARDKVENQMDIGEVESLVTNAQSWPDTCEYTVREVSS